MEPKKWWSECKKLCGMSKPSINIASKLLDESQTIEDKVNLANEINLAFLQPQKSYLKLYLNYIKSYLNILLQYI